MVKKCQHFKIKKKKKKQAYILNNFIFENFEQDLVMHHKKFTWLVQQTFLNQL
jgi:hypothetical protein